MKELGAVQAGKGTTAAGVGVVTGLLAQAGVRWAGVRLVDGSGLSLLDRMTANALVSCSRRCGTTPRCTRRCLRRCRGRPQRARFHDRMRQGAATGVVVAKTGTTDNASALSGFVGDRLRLSRSSRNGLAARLGLGARRADRFATILATS